MTILVVADGHVGSGATLGDRLADQRASWERVCSDAAEAGATLLHLGDAFHARRPGMAEMDAFQAGLDILREGNVTLIGIAGNHDVVARGVPTAFEVACSGYDAHVFREPQLVETPDGLIGLLPWMPPTMSARDTADALMIVAEDLARQGARYLVAHWALAGASLPTGLPVLDLAEPLLDSFALEQMFELTLAGHIHLRQRAAITGVWHIGALSRTTFGEASIPTGYWRIEPNVSGPVDVPDRPFVVVDAVLTGIDSAHATDGLLGEIEAYDLTGAIVRVHYLATSDQVIDTAAVVGALADAGAHYVDRIEPVIERPRSTRSEIVTETADPRASFDAWLDAQPDLASTETLSEARERAHERIGAAS